MTERNSDCLIVVDGINILQRLLDSYRKKLYEYNTLLSGTGFYLKPVHIVTRNTRGEKKLYYYYGRYWWKIKYKGKNNKTSKIAWEYIGRQKPKELAHLPDPPKNPFEGIKIVVVKNNIIIERKVYEKFPHLFKGFKIIPCNASKTDSG